MLCSSTKSFSRNTWLNNDLAIFRSSSSVKPRKRLLRWHKAGYVACVFPARKGLSFGLAAFDLAFDWAVSSHRVEKSKCQQLSRGWVHSRDDELRRFITSVIMATQAFEKRIYEVKVKTHFVLQLWIVIQNQIQVIYSD